MADPSRVISTEPVREPDSNFWRMVAVAEDQFAPRRFTATAEVREVGEVRLDVELDERGHPYCRGLAVVPAPGEVVSGDVLRRLPVGRLLAEAVAAAAFSVEDRGWTIEREGAERVGQAIDLAPTERAALYERYVRGARRPRRGSPLTDSNLRQVADLYRAALDRGDPPTQTVADAMHVARSTAARWVAAARERELLGPALRGRAGERRTTRRKR